MFSLIKSWLRPCMGWVLCCHKRRDLLPILAGLLGLEVWVSRHMNKNYRKFFWQLKKWRPGPVCH